MYTDKQFTLTSTNPCCYTAHSDSYLALLACASRHSSGEENCGKPTHWYCITNNREFGKCILYNASDLVAWVDRVPVRYPWSFEHRDELTREALLEACDALGCCADELVFPAEKDAVVDRPDDPADSFFEYCNAHRDTLPFGYGSVEFERDVWSRRNELLAQNW